MQCLPFMEEKKNLSKRCLSVYANGRLSKIIANTISRTTTSKYNNLCFLNLKKSIVKITTARATTNVLLPVETPTREIAKNGIIAKYLILVL